MKRVKMPVEIDAGSTRSFCGALLVTSLASGDIIAPLACMLVILMIAKDREQFSAPKWYYMVA